MAALGMPVVPPVYCRTARLSGPTDGRSIRGSAFTRSLNLRRPGPGVKPVGRPWRRALKGYSQESGQGSASVRPVTMMC